MVCLCGEGATGTDQRECQHPQHLHGRKGEHAKFTKLTGTEHGMGLRHLLSDHPQDQPADWLTPPPAHPLPHPPILSSTPSVTPHALTCPLPHSLAHSLVHPHTPSLPPSYVSTPFFLLSHCEGPSAVSLKTESNVCLHSNTAPQLCSLELLYQSHVVFAVG